MEILVKVLLFLSALVVLGLGITLLVFRDHVCEGGIKKKHKKNVKGVGIGFTVIGAVGVLLGGFTFTKDL